MLVDRDLVSKGRPFEYSALVVERTLWAVALEGGSATKAFKRLENEHPDEAPPPPRTIRNWKARFDVRYQEIVSSRAKDLEEFIAAQSTELAIRAHDVQVEAMRRVQAGLGATNAVEASQVLRNVAQATQSGVTQAAMLRGRAAFMPPDARAIAQLAAALEGLGVAEFVDGSAEAVTEAELAPAQDELPPGTPGT